MNIPKFSPFNKRTFCNLSEDPSTYSIIKDSIASFIEKKSRPQPLVIPRKRIELPFAVLLMRSSYNTVDELDFVPMDVFQKVFFLFRQSEWESYKTLFPNMLQGDLSDPSYFDFISFCQYAVISDRIKQGQTSFIERIGADGEAIIVTRSSEIKSNYDIPNFHTEIVGSKLLRFIDETYNADPIIRNMNNTIGNFESFFQTSQEILDLFVINGYALTATINRVNLSSKFGYNNNSSQTFKITLRAPINLWSQQVLRYRNDNPINDFENKVLNSLATRIKFNYKVLSTDITNQIDLNHLIIVSSA